MLFAKQQLNSCYKDAYRKDKYSPQVSAGNNGSSVKQAAETSTNHAVSP